MKRTKQIEEKRIYVIVPETVQVRVRGKNKTVLMESGRLTAQSVHVARKMENEIGNTYIEYTTIVLGVRNSEELALIFKLLQECDGDFSVYTYADLNPTFYGTRERVWTAICTSPVLPSQVKSAVGHLELL